MTAGKLINFFVLRLRKYGYVPAGVRTATFQHHTVYRLNLQVFFLRRNKRIKELKRALKWLNALQLLTPTSPFIVKSNLILPRGTKDKHPYNFFSPAYKIEKKEA